MIYPILLITLRVSASLRLCGAIKKTAEARRRGELKIKLNKMLPIWEIILSLCEKTMQVIAKRILREFWEVNQDYEI